ncbi:hypothetical protein Tco_0090755 [Tanacetum coccineum]
MDEEFTATAYPKVQENLKLPTEGDVRLEDPASSAATLSSLQNLDKKISFTNQFLAEKSQEDEPEKTNTEAEVQSLVTVPIHQDTSSVPLMTTPVIDLTVSQPASITIQASLPTSTATITITTTTTTLPPPSPQPQQGISNSIIIQWIGELEQSIADQVDTNQALEERLDKQGNMIHQLETQDLSRMIREQTIEYIDKQEIDRKIEETVKEAVTASVQYAMRAPLPLQKSILRDENEQFDADKAEERKKIKSKQDSPKTPPESPPPPPPPPPPSGASGASGTTGASDSAQDPLPPPQSPTTNPDDQSPGSAAPGSSKTAVTTAYTAWTTTTSRFEPSASSIPEDVFMHEESDSEAQDMVSDNEDIGFIKAFHPDVIHLQFQMEECHKILTNQVDDRLLSKGDKLALSITKMKAAYYPDVGQKFYIDRHSAETNQRAIVRTHMRILSVVRIEVFSIYEYDYMKKIVLRRADNQEYTIAENDFKDLYPSNFEDLYLQGHLNHLPPRDKKILSTAVTIWIRNLVIRQRVEDFQLGIESYQTQLNLTKPRWEATGIEFMHDYKILDSPRAVLFRDKYGMQMLMRFNEIHKFSDGTLQQIDEALDYRVKEFKVNKNNLALNTRFWTTNDVIKCKKFMFAIQKRLKLRRIFRNLESFVGGRIRDGDYRLLWRTE